MNSLFAIDYKDTKKAGTYTKRAVFVYEGQKRARHQKARTLLERDINRLSYLFF
jgi:hypothetical protein